MKVESNKAYEELLKRCGSPDIAIATQAMAELALAEQETLRKGVLVGDNLRDVYNQVQLPDGEEYLEFSLDMLSPGEEDEYVAYTIPATGSIPMKNIAGDYVRVPCYQIGHSIDWDLRYAEKGMSFQIGRVLDIFRAGFSKKMNDDGWQTIITAAADRNVLVYDADAGAGQFTKRLLSLAKLIMRRNGGGNSGSIKRSKLTDAFISPEGEEDVRNWGIDQVDDITRREIYTAEDGSTILTRIHGVNLHSLDELGEGQIYQDFYTNTLGASLQASDVELAIGLDLENRDAFYMPMGGDIAVFSDMQKHRDRKQGVYGWFPVGFGVIDSRRVIAMSF